VTIAAPATVADANTWALAMNVTAVSPTASTFLTFWPDGDRPSASTLNPAKGQTVANSAITTLSVDANQFSAYNQAGTTGLLVDISGYYEFDPNTFSGSAKAGGVTPFTQGAGKHHTPAAAAPHTQLIK
jgi:hypothetical protein